MSSVVMRTMLCKRSVPLRLTLNARSFSAMASRFKSLRVNGYDELKSTLKTIEKDKRVFVLFYGAKDSQGRSWCPDCNAVDEPIAKTVPSLLPSNGVFVECSVGDRASWKDSNSSFRKDPQLRLTNIPTLVEWGTSKRLTENQLLDSDMIKILFEED